MPRYAPAVTALADRLAARTLELVDIPSQSGDEAAIRERLLALVPHGLGDRVRRRRGLSLRADAQTRASAGRSGRALRHGAGTGQHPRADRGRRRPWPRVERHEGWARGRARAVLAISTSRPRPATSRSCSSVARSYPRSTTHSPRSSMDLQLVHEATLAVVLEPTDLTIQAGCLGNVVARARVSRDEWARGASLARGQRARACRARPRAALRPGASRCCRERPRVQGGDLGHAPSRRDRGQRHPGRGDRDAEPSLSPGSRAGGRRGVPRRARPRRTRRSRS